MKVLALQHSLIEIQSFDRSTWIDCNSTANDEAPEHG